MAELKDTINTMVDQLSIFAEEVSHVALRVSELKVHTWSASKC